MGIYVVQRPGPTLFRRLARLRGVIHRGKRASERAPGTLSRVEKEFGECLKEAAAHVRGEIALRAYEYEVPGPVDAKAIRGKSGLSQSQFARRLGFSTRTLRDWELAGRNRRAPSARISWRSIDSRRRWTRRYWAPMKSPSPAMGDGPYPPYARKRRDRNREPLGGQEESSLAVCAARISEEREFYASLGPRR